MALATKCPHCHTVFRVALDQLKLRGGIVRCGACNEIFDGNAALVDPAAAVAAPVVAPLAVSAAPAPKLDLELDLDEPSTAVVEEPPAVNTGSGGSAGPEASTVPPAQSSASRNPGSTPTGLTPAFASGEESRAQAAQQDQPQHQPLGSDPTGQTPVTAADQDKPENAFPPQPEPEPLPEPDPEHALPRREPAFDTPSEHLVAVALDDLHHFDDAPEPVIPAAPPEAEAERSANEAAERSADDASAADLLTAAPESALLAAGAGGAAAVPDTGESAEDEPEFVRQAERRERSRNLARLAMIAGIPLLAFVLLGQGVYSLRNRLAVDYPSLKPALQALCAPLGCTVELPRQIDALAIEQGELQTLAPNTYSFVTVLRNQSRSVQAWPHIELVLNDTADKPVLRRVFAPRDYLGRGAAAAGFGPRSEQAVKLYFQLDGLRASGYHIAIFYP